MDNPRVATAANEDIDGLRLAALGRIDRCSRCPRYEALVAGYLADRLEARPHCRPLPAVPGECRFQACTPLVARRSWADLPATADPAAVRRAVC